MDLVLFRSRVERWGGGWKKRREERNMATKMDVRSPHLPFSFELAWPSRLIRREQKRRIPTLLYNIWVKYDALGERSFAFVSVLQWESGWRERKKIGQKHKKLTLALFVYFCIVYYYYFFLRAVMAVTEGIGYDFDWIWLFFLPSIFFLNSFFSFLPPSFDLDPAQGSRSRIPTK